MNGETRQVVLLGADGSSPCPPGEKRTRYCIIGETECCFWERCEPGTALEEGLRREWTDCFLLISKSVHKNLEAQCLKSKT